MICPCGQRLAYEWTNPYRIVRYREVEGITMIEYAVCIHGIVVVNKDK